MLPIPVSLSARLRRLGAGASLGLAAALLVGGASRTAAYQPAQRTRAAVLTIGNSFADDSTAFLPDLVRAAGKELLLFRANLGGASLERHARHLRLYQADPDHPEARPYECLPDPRTGEVRDFGLPEALAAYPWDFVTIQQVSWQSFVPETYHPHVDELIAAIRQYAPQAEILVHETWAYREDHPIYRRIEGFSPEKMYQDLRAAYRRLADAHGLRMLLVGDAFHLARRTPRWSYVRDPDLDLEAYEPGEVPEEPRALNVGWYWTDDTETCEPEMRYDGIHATTAGRYLGAAVFYQTLYNTDQIPDHFVPEGLSRWDAATLRHVAQAAVLSERALETYAAH